MDFNKLSLEMHINNRKDYIINLKFVVNLTI